MQIPLLSRSEQLLLALKLQKDDAAHRQALAEVTLVELKQQLTKDEEKKTFWINCYNAYFLHWRRDQQVDKPAIYRDKLIQIAQQQFSLDDIEHGILRRYRAKWSLGFLPNWGTSAMLRKLAVERIDYRLHFALNCGAVSCPPIAFYQADKIDQQLEWAAASFLEQETVLDTDARVAYLSRLGFWYLGDFGGYRGLRQMVKHYLKTDITGWQIRFRDYDWSEDLNNFA